MRGRLRRLLLTLRLAFTWQGSMPRRQVARIYRRMLADMERDDYTEPGSIRLPHKRRWRYRGKP